MENKLSINHASCISHYQAVNCNGKDLGVVEGIVPSEYGGEDHVLMSTHHKDLFGNLKYAVPVSLCEIDHENKTVWVNIDKNELEFLYKFSDLYEKGVDFDINQYLHVNRNNSANFGNQSVSM